MTGRAITSWALAFGVALIAGCATPTSAPVLDRSTPVAKSGAESSGEYIVRPKDSLYRIAWTYELDYRNIARHNGIKPPYTIYPGQKLSLYGANNAASPSADAPKTRSGKTSTTRTTPGVAARPAPSPAKRPVAKPIPKPVAKPVPRPQPKPPAAQQTVRNQPGYAGWRWPVNAQPSRGFGRGNNGLDYVLANGQRVVAAATGEVVYAGPGIGGYRHLVIVEHSDRYLSAYNLNVPPAVAEGSRIAGGGKVCDIGSGTPATRRLHFEIRRNGTPVDPVSVIGSR